MIKLAAGAAWLARRGGRSGRAREVPEPNGEAIIGVPERDVDVKLVHDPQPESKAPVGGAAWRGDQACQAIGGAAAGVVDGDHDAARRGPDAHEHGWAAVALGVGDG